MQAPQPNDATHGLSSSSSQMQSPFAADQQQFPANDAVNVVSNGRLSSLDSAVAARDVRMLIGRQAEIEQVSLLGEDLRKASCALCLEQVLALSPDHAVLQGVA